MNDKGLIKIAHVILFYEDGKQVRYERDELPDEFMRLVRG